MIIFGLFSSIVFIAFQFKVVRRAFSKIWDIKITFNRENTVAGDEIENGDSDDDDVYREANVVRQRSHNSTFLLEVNVNYFVFFGKTVSGHEQTVWSDQSRGPSDNGNI